MRRRTNKQTTREQERPKIQDAAGNAVRNSERVRGTRDQDELISNRSINMDRNIYRMNDLYERGSI
jgi:hypothetical protein